MTVSIRSLRRQLATAAASVAILGAAFLSTPALEAQGRSIDGERFVRIATFPVWRNTSVDLETVAEIVTATADGITLVYTDSEQELIGFIDITDPENPEATGTVALGGEPTSVGVKGNEYALAAYNTSEDFVNVSGSLAVIDIATQTIVREIDLGGQPDAVAVSPDGNYAIVAIENERDEDLGDGGLPQLPAGNVVVLDISGAVADWTATPVAMTGLADVAPEDPEPEYVDINTNNEAVISLQENNHIVILDLETLTVINEFSAGNNRARSVDTEEEGLITFDSETIAPREPDGISWIGTDFIATADEGDIGKGGRSFTIFNTEGQVVDPSRGFLDRDAARFGHYPEERSGNRGVEPENVEYATYNDQGVLFVGLERANLLGVFSVNEATGRTRRIQYLPTGIAPEGIIAIPSRDLVVVASEDDVRDDAHRSGVTIYRLQSTDRSVTANNQRYPKVRSGNDANGFPIPWAALSGLSITDDAAYTVSDSFFSTPFIYEIDGGRTLTITRRIAVSNADGTTPNLDLEGIQAAPDGGFWLVSEGNTSSRQNMLIKTDANGVIANSWGLGDTLEALLATDRADRFGFEGVAVRQEMVDGEMRPIAYVAIQREFVTLGDEVGMTRIARFDTGTGEVTFAYYELEDATSPNGGWVGLAGLTFLDDGSLLVMERDNQGNDDARVKQLTTVNVDSVTFAADSGNGTPSLPTLAKTVVRDLIASGDFEAFGGAVLEKIEGIAIDPSGRAIIINDNDGVDDNNGETQIIIVKQ